MKFKAGDMLIPKINVTDSTGRNVCWLRRVVSVNRSKIKCEVLRIGWAVTEEIEYADDFRFATDEEIAADVAERLVK